MNKTVSIIIPVYNAGEVIARCLKSVENQIYKNYEVIIIDDGSTDKSKDIIGKIVLKHKNWKFVSINNSGVSYARNVGIELAQGELICFVDSDDYISPYYLLNLVQAWKSGQWTISHFNYIINGKIKSNGKYVGEKNINDIIKLFLNTLISQPWNKIYEKKVIEKFHIRFDTQLSIAEDFFFNMDYLKYCQSIFVVGKSDYNYVVSNQGLNTSQKRGNTYLNILSKQCSRLCMIGKKFNVDTQDIFKLDYHYICQLWQVLKVDEIKNNSQYYHVVCKNLQRNNFLFFIAKKFFEIGNVQASIIILKIMAKFIDITKKEYIMNFDERNYIE